MRVLIVDDSQVKMSVYTQGLEMRGFRVDHQNTVGGALTAFEREPFPYDVVVIDLMMAPGELVRDDADQGIDTGLRLYHQFRTKYRRREPVVILSSFLGTVDLLPIEQDQLARALAKSETRPSQLLQAINELVRLAAARRADGSQRL